jgi:hypothetical protein
VSAASYHLFAAAFDVCLIPFYVFAALLSHNQLDQGADRSWSTLFSDPNFNTTTWIFSTFLLGVVDGGLHLLSMAISIYLAVTFRKIANLPPDMNPLEPNLTSRNSTRRHKAKQSDATSMSGLDKRFSASTNQSTTSFSSPADLRAKRASQASEELVPHRSVPFMHTRNDSGVSLPMSDRSSQQKDGTRYTRNRDSRTDLPSQLSTVANNRPSSIHRSSPTKSRAKSISRESVTSSNTKENTRDLTAAPNAGNWFYGSEGMHQNENDSRAPSIRSDNPTENSVLSYGYQYETVNPLAANPPTPNKEYTYGHHPSSTYSTDLQDVGLALGSPNRSLAGSKSSKKGYGQLTPQGTTPTKNKIMGTYVDIPREDRVVSSGADYHGGDLGAQTLGRRDVSGKIAEEGRGGSTWARWRMISGKE